MNIKHRYIAILILIAGLSSCRKFVEVEQPNQREFRYTSDYLRLMSNRSIFERTANTPMISADDINLDANSNLQNLLSSGIDSAYIWGSAYYNADQSDVTWDQLYNSIYNANLVIDGVMDSEEGTEVQKKSTLAEAKVQRAYIYLTLVNIYARPMQRPRLLRIRVCLCCLLPTCSLRSNAFLFRLYTIRSSKI